jgi:hypothetical protein
VFPVGKLISERPPDRSERGGISKIGLTLIVVLTCHKVLRESVPMRAVETSSPRSS